MKINRAKLAEYIIMGIIWAYCLATFLVKPIACVGFDVMCDLWQG